MPTLKWWDEVDFLFVEVSDQLIELHLRVRVVHLNPQTVERPLGFWGTRRKLNPATRGYAFWQGDRGLPMPPLSNMAYAITERMLLTSPNSFIRKYSLNRSLDRAA